MPCKGNETRVGLELKGGVGVEDAPPHMGKEPSNENLKDKDCKMVLREGGGFIPRPGIERVNRSCWNKKNEEK